MKLLLISMMSFLLLTVLLPTRPSGAIDFFSHSQRTRTKCSLPKQNYNYSGNVWPFTGPSKFGATAIAVAATDPTDIQRAERVKPFHFRTRRLIVDHLTLDQVGLAIDTNGRIYASGRISHSGGDGGLIGNNVTVSHSGLRFPHDGCCTCSDRPPCCRCRVNSDTIRSG